MEVVSRSCLCHGLMHNNGMESAHVKILILALSIFILFSVMPKEGLGKDACIHSAHIPWKALSYRHDSFFYDIDIAIKAELLDKNDPEAIKVFDTYRKHNATKMIHGLIQGKHVLKISVESSVRPLIGHEEKNWTRAWYLVEDRICMEPSLEPGKKFMSSKGIVLLRYDKLSMGKEKRLRIFWPVDRGILRLKKMPSKDEEKPLSPEQWTGSKETLYPYGMKGVSKRDIIEPSLLMLLACSNLFLRENTCIPVFNKREIYLLHGKSRSLRCIPEESEIKNSKAPFKTKGARYVVVSFYPQSLGGREEAERRFSFFGLKGNFDIVVDKTKGVPILIRGRLPGFGKVTIRLYKNN